MPPARPASHAPGRDRGRRCAVAARWRCPRPGPMCSRSLAADSDAGRSLAGGRPGRRPSATRRRADSLRRSSPIRGADSASRQQALGGPPQGQRPSAAGRSARRWCCTPQLGGAGAPRPVRLRRPGHPRSPDQGLSVAGPCRAPRRLEHAGQPAKTPAATCWPRSRPARCRAPISRPTWFARSAT